MNSIILLMIPIIVFPVLIITWLYLQKTPVKPPITGISNEEIERELEEE